MACVCSARTEAAAHHAGKNSFKGNTQQKACAGRVVSAAGAARALQHMHGVRVQRAHRAAAHHAGKNSFTDLGLHDMKISTGNDSSHLPTTANLKEAFAVEKPRQTASSSSDKRKLPKQKVSITSITPYETN
ncbi:hypothetical protein MSG28_000212 [Choristoneura fumiferana]|uniref:Uncharacterized protein n=1 Tax=Choristoneura fumiferana TaxID=7141 RepID=A0ACC0JZR7_CHOFU|nr:hypothetical protein MSG28_000212 [Choristoneura fumiferana]